MVLSPGEKWGEVNATLHGDLATIVEWTGNGGGESGTGTPRIRIVDLDQYGDAITA